MEEIFGEGLIDLVQFVLGVGAFVIMMFLVYLGVRILHKIMDEF